MIDWWWITFLHLQGSERETEPTAAALTCQTFYLKSHQKLSICKKNKKINSDFIPFSHSQIKSTTKWRWVPVISIPNDKTFSVEKQTQENRIINTSLFWEEFQPRPTSEKLQELLSSLKLLVTWNWWRVTLAKEMLDFRLKLHIYTC